MSFETMSKADLVKAARKLDQEAKLSETKITDLESELAKFRQVAEGNKAELTHNAVGFYQGEDKKFYVAKLKFNPISGEAIVEGLEGHVQPYKAYDQALRKLEQQKV